MELNLDDYYEDKWEAGIESGHARGGKKHHKELTESEKTAIEAEKQRLIEERQTEASEQIEDFIEDRFGKLTGNKREEKVQAYLDWVKESLKSGYPDYNEKEIEVKTFLSSGPGGQHHQKNETGVVLTHKSALISAKEDKERSKNANEKKAQTTLMERLEKHLDIWKQTSNVFKMEKGVI